MFHMVSHQLHVKGNGMHEMLLFSAPCWNVTTLPSFLYLLGNICSDTTWFLY